VFKQEEFVERCLTLLKQRTMKIKDIESSETGNENRLISDSLR
jgi:hypothetical protein